VPRVYETLPFEHGKVRLNLVTQSFIAMAVREKQTSHSCNQTTFVSTASQLLYMVRATSVTAYAEAPMQDRLDDASDRTY
jgi:hypothetical protein